MNRTFFWTVILFSLIKFCAQCAESQSADSYADKYYQAFNARLDDGGIYLLASFRHDVPVSLQSEVLEKIMDRAFSAKSAKNYRVIICTLVYLREFGSNLILSKKLDEYLYALAKDENDSIRRDVIEVFAGLKRSKDDTLILNALQDSSDDVRGSAIKALVHKSGTQAIYRKFIQDHQSDPNYNMSIQYAKGALDEIHEAQKSNTK